MRLFRWKGPGGIALAGVVIKEGELVSEAKLSKEFCLAYKESLEVVEGEKPEKKKPANKKSR